MAELFTVRVEGEEEVRALFGLLESNAADLGDVLTLIGEGINQEQRAAIDKGLTPGLSPDYAKKKAKAGKGGEPVLVFNRDLYNSFDTMLLGPTEVSAGSDDPKLPFHASLEPRSKMPFRDPVSIDEEKWGPLIEDLVLDGLFRGINVEVSVGAA